MFQQTFQAMGSGFGLAGILVEYCMNYAVAQ